MLIGSFLPRELGRCRFGSNLHGFAQQAPLPLRGLLVYVDVMGRDVPVCLANPRRAGCPRPALAWNVIPRCRGALICHLVLPMRWSLIPRFWEMPIRRAGRPRPAVAWLLSHVGYKQWDAPPWKKADEHGEIACRGGYHPPDFCRYLRSRRMISAPTKGKSVKRGGVRAPRPTEIHRRAFSKRRAESSRPTGASTS